MAFGKKKLILPMLEAKFAPAKPHSKAITINIPKGVFGFCTAIPSQTQGIIRIRQITRDHSYVEEMVRIGELDRADARNHPDKNIITRAVGAEDKVEPDFFTVELQEGEIVLMCSDGLTNMLEDEEIRMIISGARDLVEKAESLVEAANANGGRDNISVILIEPCA